MQTFDQIDNQMMMNMGEERVSLVDMVGDLVQHTYQQLNILTDLLAQKNDSDSKIEIVTYAAKTRQMFVRLLCLITWASSQSNKLERCAEIMSLLRNQGDRFTQVADWLVDLSRNILSAHACLPTFSIPAAASILNAGDYPKLPTCLKDSLVPMKPLTSNEKIVTRTRLNELIMIKLLHHCNSIPGPLRSCLVVEDGILKLTIPGEFCVFLTLTCSDVCRPWRVISLEILVHDQTNLTTSATLQKLSATAGKQRSVVICRPEAEPSPLIHAEQVKYLSSLLQNHLLALDSVTDESKDASTNPTPASSIIKDDSLEITYNLMHTFCQSLQLELLRCQATHLSRIFLTKVFAVDRFVPARSFTLTYWTRRFHQAIVSNQNEENETSKHRLSFPSEVKTVRFSITFTVDEDNEAQRGLHLRHTPETRGLPKLLSPHQLSIQALVSSIIEKRALTLLRCVRRAVAKSGFVYNVSLLKNSSTNDTTPPSSPASFSFTFLPDSTELMTIFVHPRSGDLALSSEILQGRSVSANQPSPPPTSMGTVCSAGSQLLPCQHAPSTSGRVDAWLMWSLRQFLWLLERVSIDLYLDSKLNDHQNTPNGMEVENGHGTLHSTGLGAISPLSRESPGFGELCKVVGTIRRCIWRIRIGVDILKIIPASLSPPFPISGASAGSSGDTQGAFCIPAHETLLPNAELASALKSKYPVMSEKLSRGGVVFVIRLVNCSFGNSTQNDFLLIEPAFADEDPINGDPGVSLSAPILTTYLSHCYYVPESLYPLALRAFAAPPIHMSVANKVFFGSLMKFVVPSASPMSNDFSSIHSQIHRALSHIRNSLHARQLTYCLTRRGFGISKPVMKPSSGQLSCGLTKISTTALTTPCQAIIRKFLLSGTFVGQQRYKNGGTLYRWHLVVKFRNPTFQPNSRVTLRKSADDCPVDPATKVITIDAYFDVSHNGSYDQVSGGVLQFFESVARMIFLVTRYAVNPNPCLAIACQKFGDLSFEYGDNNRYLFRLSGYRFITVLPIYPQNTRDPVEISSFLPPHCPVNPHFLVRDQLINSGWLPRLVQAGTLASPSVSAVHHLPGITNPAFQESNHLPDLKVFADILHATARPLACVYSLLYNQKDTTDVHQLSPWSVHFYLPTVAVLTYRRKLGLKVFLRPSSVVLQDAATIFSQNHQHSGATAIPVGLRAPAPSRLSTCGTELFDFLTSQIRPEDVDNEAWPCRRNVSDVSTEDRRQFIKSTFKALGKVELCVETFEQLCGVDVADLNIIRHDAPLTAFMASRIGHI